MKRIIGQVLFLLMIALAIPQTIAAQEVKELTMSEFSKKVANVENTEEWKFLGKRPAIVDFYASWCGPCKKMAPILDQLAKEYEGKVDIYKVNVDKEQKLAALFSIRSIPSLLFIPMSDKPIMAQGALPKDELKKAIDDVLLQTGK